jgi:amidase
VSRVATRKQTHGRPARRVRAAWPGQIEGSAGGAPAGATFAVKDIFDVAGTVPGRGNPDWLTTHAPAIRDAPAVQALLDAGARLVGRTITEELAFSVVGTSPHYGTPRNVAAPGRVPGGSSSGSATAWSICRLPEGPVGPSLLRARR